MQARERGDSEMVGKLTRVRIDMGDSLRESYRSEMNWDGDENKNNDDGDKTWESLTSANKSPMDVVRLHCNIGTGKGERAYAAFGSNTPNSQAKKAGITSTTKEGWANCVPLAVRR